MTNKFLPITLILLSLFFTLDASAYIIIKRTVDDCSRNEKCASTSKQLCQFSGPNGPIVGFCIVCSDPGSSPCPTSVSSGFPGTGDLDPTDISESQILIDYALDQIANANLSGSHPITVEDRTYTVTWTSDVDNTNTEIIIDRQDL